MQQSTVFLFPGGSSGKPFLRNLGLETPLVKQPADVHFMVLYTQSSFGLGPSPA